MKGSRQRVGAIGEALATAWLLESGYEILHLNWRTGRYEIDIIAARQGVLHFVEVKTKRSARYGHPEQQVGRKKLRHLIAAGTEYIARDKRWKRIRFDILSIRLFAGAPPTYFFIEDVYL
ncbi:MAG: YraN family protein [Bacteroidetes bacterium]|nr:YraN family protein [Bacteroidota bacterium]